MTRVNQILLATTFAVALSSGVASAAVMDDQGTSAERAPDVRVVVLNPNGRKNREFDYYLSQPAMYHAAAESTISKNPALAAELRGMNVEMSNVVGVQHWGNGDYTVFLR